MSAIHTIAIEFINRTSIGPNGAKNCRQAVVDAVTAGGSRFTSSVVAVVAAEAGYRIVSK